MKPIVCGTFLAFNLMLAAPAFAAPVLKTQVDVSGQVVTVGDMFEDAGASAARPLFLAPAPGTTGTVGIDDIRVAAVKAGVTIFEDEGLTSVRVSRLATPVGAPLLDDLIATELKSRGLLTDGVKADASFDTPVDGLVAAAEPSPVRLLTLRYTSDGGQSVQLCQHHCPVVDAAAQFPELCEAETQALSDALGLHVTRLATLAKGDGVCTTVIPLVQRKALA